MENFVLFPFLRKFVGVKIDLKTKSNEQIETPLRHRFPNHVETWVTIRQHSKCSKDLSVQQLFSQDWVHFRKKENGKGKHFVYVFATTEPHCIKFIGWKV